MRRTRRAGIPRFIMSVAFARPTDAILSALCVGLNKRYGWPGPRGAGSAEPEVRGPVGDFGHVKASDSLKTLAVAALEELDTSSVSFESPHSSNTITIGGRRKVVISLERRR